MSVKLLTKHHLEFLSLKGGCTGWSEYALCKIPHCLKSRITAQYCQGGDPDKFFFLLLFLVINVFHRGRYVQNSFEKLLHPCSGTITRPVSCLFEQI